MTDRARYDGPHDEVNVFNPDDGVYAKPIDTVKRGGLLSKDAPAKIRDELLARDNWTAVKDPAGSKSTDATKEG